jgi:hypothetical protein
MHLNPPLRHWHPVRDGRRLIAEFTHTPAEVTVLAGVWLTAAPLLFDHNAAAAPYAGWSDVIAGLTLVALAYLHVVHPAGTTRVSMLTGLTGVWVMVSPFVRGYTGSATATWNDLLTGAAVVALSTVTWWTERRPAA